MSVLAFGRVAEDLARSAKDEAVSVSGRLNLNRYQSRDGEDREAWQCIADSVVSSRSVRPRGGRRTGEARGGGNEHGRGPGPEGAARPPADASRRGGEYRTGPDREYRAPELARYSNLDGAVQDARGRVLARWLAASLRRWRAFAPVVDATCPAAYQLPDGGAVVVDAA